MDSSSSTGSVAETPARSSKSSQRSSGRRTHRACDRCRVKKSKCNGQQPCNTCKANERTCVFSALRRRDIRKWHCHMQDTVDEAIQRLYRACKAGACFPGVLPDEKDGYVTTESILLGMGFTNLDLGPPVHGIVAHLQQLPMHPRVVNGVVDTRTMRPPDIPTDIPMPYHRNSDTASVDSALSPASPRLSPEFHISPGLARGLHPQQSAISALPISDHFHGMANSQMPGIYLQNQYHHHHYHRQLPEQQQQHTQHMDQQNHHDPIMHASTPFVGTNRCTQPPPTFDFKQQYSISPYYTYDSGPFVSPDQVWSGPHEIAPVSQ